MKRTLIALTALASLFAAIALAQPGAPKPPPAYTTSVDALMSAYYKSFSGPAGEERDWDRFGSLFYPGGRLIPTLKNPQGGAYLGVIAPEDFAKRAGATYEERGYYEIEVHRVVESFGNIAHVLSTFESRRELSEASFLRGINSVQLLRDGGRWWIVNVFWDTERPGLTIPDKYLP